MSINYPRCPDKNVDMEEAKAKNKKMAKEDHYEEFYVGGKVNEADGNQALRTEKECKAELTPATNPPQSFPELFLEDIDDSENTEMVEAFYFRYSRRTKEKYLS